MKNLFLISTFLLSLSLQGTTQCSFKKISQRYLNWGASEQQPTIEKATILRSFFDKYDFVGNACFAQSEGGETYLFLQMGRKMSKKFSIAPNDPLILTMESGKTIELIPNGTYKGKMVLTNYAISCFYSINRNQLEAIANDKVEKIRVNITSEKPITGRAGFDDMGWKIDENDDSYYTTTIQSKGKRKKFTQGARCMTTIAQK